MLAPATTPEEPLLSAEELDMFVSSFNLPQRRNATH
jgi:hypothetical protein